MPESVVTSQYPGNTSEKKAIKIVHSGVQKTVSWKRPVTLHCCFG